MANNLTVSLHGGLLCLGIIVCLYAAFSEGRLRALPLPTYLRDCYARGQNYTTQDYVGGMFCWYCESPIRAFEKGKPQPLQKEQYEYYRHLYTKVQPKLRAGSRVKRQAGGTYCVRKEYRMLTDNERLRFHNAVNTLKRDNSTIQPNKYDALALFHSGVATFVAHGGPGFPGWHRIYLLLFEAALQEVDPTVCLPYWDSSLDSSLPNPAESYVWSNDFFGGWDGDLLTGAFSDWVTPEGVNLRRSVGRDGQLFTVEGIEAIMSQNTYEDILLPESSPEFSLEVLHGGAHVFVGGAMERLDTAAYDIIFFMHHAFVDYIWEMFRNKMRNNGLDPMKYPVGSDLSDYHLATALMGFDDLTQENGYNDTLTSSYEYEPSPECSERNPDCGSRYLWCNVTSARCVPIDPSNPPVTVPGPHPCPSNKKGCQGGGPQPCPGPKPQAYQNSFCINGVCDVNQWVWVPVKIMAQRAPDFHDYHAYPVQDGHIRKASDIYEPSLYQDTTRYLKPLDPKPKSYDHCITKDGVGKIFVTSMGVNYDGVYKESAIMDQRLATSIGVTYVAVKDPAHSTTQVVLRAHDACGRICHTACQVPGSYPPKYEACSGVVEVTPTQPFQYGKTYASATLSVYDYASDPNCPSFNTDNIFVSFFCDYKDRLPWVDKPIVTSPPRPVHIPKEVVRPVDSHQCQLSSRCTINTQCYQDQTHGSNPRQCNKYMEMHECVGNCGHYAVCIYGVYWPRQCPSGMRFSSKYDKCVRGSCSGSLLNSLGMSSGSTGVRKIQVRPSFGTDSYYGKILNRFGSLRGRK